MKTLILGITSLAIANIFAIPAYADLSIGTSFSSGNTRVIIQYGTPSQYGSYDPYDRYSRHHSHHRENYYQNVVPIYRQPNYSYHQIPNPYSLPTNTNLYNRSIVETQVSPSPRSVYIYEGNPNSYHRHHRYYSH
ncbi:hypothetical protein V2H45_07255 [Tumidithrix elongata RA019]|uniref:Uncharacterized protein n=1 Tax=Tumidithrix elongata BACA0141 TaxID=2716417 RepID=A0AAW9PVZ8_9CYAN|nr:hypothetical protein [Tumidithrix elongata RA019]